MGTSALAAATGAAAALKTRKQTLKRQYEIIKLAQRRRQRRQQRQQQLDQRGIPQEKRDQTRGQPQQKIKEHGDWLVCCYFFALSYFSACLKISVK